MWLCGASYFIQFLAMAFASFPLQTQMRQLMDPSSASLVAGLTPIATCSTYFLFRWAESRGWAGFPQRLLAIATLLLALAQGLLGWQLTRLENGQWAIGPAIDTGFFLLLMGCANATCMILLNHIAVASFKDHAYVVRAAGTTGFMVAVILFGVLGNASAGIERNHLFIACLTSIVHGMLAMWGVFYLGNWRKGSPGHSATTVSLGIVGEKAKPILTRSSLVTWWGLLILVWLVSMCEMAYGLYSHQFMTEVYGAFGYYLFASGLAIEIVLLLVISRADGLRSRLLFLGPLGWILLMAGGLLALGGFPPFGFLTLAMALNCPFQMSVNQHVHRIDERILGIASVSLAQAVGFISAAGLSSVVSHAATGPRNLWLCMIPVATIAMLLAVWKLKRMPA